MWFEHLIFVLIFFFLFQSMKRLCNHKFGESLCDLNELCFASNLEREREAPLTAGVGQDYAKTLPSERLLCPPLGGML